MYIWIFLNAKLISLGKSHGGTQGHFIFVTEFLLALPCSQGPLSHLKIILHFSLSFYIVPA